MVLEAIHQADEDFEDDGLPDSEDVCASRVSWRSLADGIYRHVARPKKLRFGFGGQSAEMPFSEEVTESLREAAAAVGVDLLVLDNRYDAADRAARMRRVRARARGPGDRVSGGAARRRR